MRKTLIAVFTAIVLFTSCNLLQRNEVPVAVEPQMLNSADSICTPAFAKAKIGIIIKLT